MNIVRRMCVGCVVAAVGCGFGGAATMEPAGSTSRAALAVPPPVEGYPIGWCIRARADSFQEAKKLGYEFVELALQDVLAPSDADFERLRKALEATGVPALSGYNSVPKTIVIVGPDADVGKQEAHFKTMLARTEALKLKFLVFNGGGSWKIPDGYDKKKAWEELVDFSKRFAIAAGKHGMTVLVEPARTSDSNQVTTIAEAAKLVDAVGDPHFAMMVDYSLLVMQKDDFGELVKAGPRLKHVWISNPANNRTYAMDDKESDYASFFAALKKMGYRGDLTVHGAPVTTLEADGPRAIAFLREKGKALSER